MKIGTSTYYIFTFNCMVFRDEGSQYDWAASSGGFCWLWNL